MTKEQQDILRKVLHGALEQFQMIDYGTMMHICASLCAAMLIAWGLGKDDPASWQAGRIMEELQQYIILVSPVEER